MMKRTLFAVAAALPLSLALAACGEPLDGSDTANMEPDASAPEAAGMSADNVDATTGENPAEDGMLQTEVEPTGEPIADSTAEPTM